MSSLQIFAATVVLAIATILIHHHSKRPAFREGQRRHLTYTLPYQVLILLLVTLMLVIADFCVRAQPDERLIALPVGATCLAIATGYVYRTFFISLAYDEDYLYFSSPLRGEHAIPWQNIVAIHYSPWLQCHCIRTTTIAHIWCADTLRGYWEFGHFLGEKYEQLYGDGSGDGYAPDD